MTILYMSLKHEGGMNIHDGDMCFLEFTALVNITPAMSSHVLLYKRNVAWGFHSFFLLSQSNFALLFK